MYNKELNDSIAISRGKLMKMVDDIRGNDRSIFMEKFFDKPELLADWDKIEWCLNNPYMFDLTFIDKETANLIPLEKRMKHWYGWVLDKREINRVFNTGNSVCVNNYTYYNDDVVGFVTMFEEMFFVSAAAHLYAGLEGSKSFKIHEDYPANFIVQIEGSTPWKVYKQRSSNLFPVNNNYTANFDEKQFDIEWEGILNPGDCLYIPARAYHACSPTEKRISISVPCWTRVDLSDDIINDRQYRQINHNGTYE